MSKDFPALGDIFFLRNETLLPQILKLREWKRHRLGPRDPR